MSSFVTATPWVAAYWAISSSMIVFNSLSARGLRLPFLTLAYQVVVTIVYALCKEPRACVQALKRPTNLNKWSLAALLFCATIGSSMQALVFVSMQTVLVARNLTMVAVALVDAKVFNFKLTTPLLGSIAVVIIGVAIFAAHDLTAFNMTGYAWVLANVSAICMYNMFSKKVMNTIKVSNSVQILYMQGLALPMLLALGALAGEFSQVHSTLAGASQQTLAAVLLSGVVGVLISFVGTQVQRLLAVTSYTIMTNLNKLFTFVLAQLVEQNDLLPNAKIGVFISFVGGFLYSYLVFKRDQSEAKSDKKHRKRPS